MAVTIAAQDAMSFHSASRCVNNRARYAWTSAFFDDRAVDQPHKLYQRAFAPRFCEAIPAPYRTLVDWVGPFVAAYLGDVQAADTQNWCYGARRRGGAVREVPGRL
jgi:hypothetical protein